MQSNAEFLIRYGEVEDVHRIRAIIDISHKMLEDKSWYNVSDMTAEWLAKKANSDDGFILVAEVDDAIAGFLVVSYPRGNEKCLEYIPDSSGRNINAEICNCAVLPQYRGRGLQRILMNCAEKEMPTWVRNLICTTHPDNFPSYCNIRRCGYEEVTVVKKMYDSSPRCIFLKKL